ncbi:cyclic nucleotide-binding domain-containing protein [Pyxidicoccus xibeiensis]|uniref:cyclic nucleotide-binding domain-containing protein n=1 Tax=Pyxidicoccus xibeiensis TaxID=2906759 RepID=UPI0020A80C21|nr:cyclic nucleotide-binding domain-containing protein [Pyxidicoccus xibeiensis]MCP3144868.1 cyclic nucleotide-binding domain-containing protein [Pyxidicoccus xibeiensis]
MAASMPVWTRFYPAGRTVVREGDIGDSMFVIVEGRVAVMRQPDAGSGTTVRELSTGDFFGELALVTDCRRTASVVAVERTVLLEFSRAGLEEAGARHGIQEAVVRMTCQERLLADAFRDTPLLAELSPELKLELGSAFVPCAVEQGELLLTRGKPGTALYVLLRGRCAVFHTHNDGHTTPYPDLEEGAVFGEVSLLRGRPASATVKAATPCTLLRVERDVFRKFFLGEPALRRALVRLGLERMTRTLQVMVRSPYSMCSD